MKSAGSKLISRRGFLGTAAAGLGVALAAPAIAQNGTGTVEFERDLGSNIRRNIFSNRCGSALKATKIRPCSATVPNGTLRR